MNLFFSHLLLLVHTLLLHSCLCAVNFLLNQSVYKRAALAALVQTYGPIYQLAYLKKNLNFISKTTCRTLKLK